MSSLTLIQKAVLSNLFQFVQPSGYYESSHLTDRKNNKRTVNSLYKKGLILPHNSNHYMIGNPFPYIMTLQAAEIVKQEGLVHVQGYHNAVAEKETFKRYQADPAGFNWEKENVYCLNCGQGLMTERFEDFRYVRIEGFIAHHNCLNCIDTIKDRVGRSNPDKTLQAALPIALDLSPSFSVYDAYNLNDHLLLKKLVRIIAPSVGYNHPLLVDMEVWELKNMVAHLVESYRKKHPLCSCGNPAEYSDPFKDFCGMFPVKELCQACRNKLDYPC